MSFSTLVSNEPLAQRLFRHRDQIPLRTDVLWRIERGAVRTQTWSEEGTIITLGYWGAGDVVGQPLSKMRSYEIECMTSVETSILPSHLWSQMLEALVEHRQQVEQLLSFAHRHPVQERLWYFLVWLGQKFGRDIEQGRLIDLQLSHQEIAEAINTTRVTVTRTLQQLTSEGLLRHPHFSQTVLKT